MQLAMQISQRQIVVFQQLNAQGSVVPFAILPANVENPDQTILRTVYTSMPFATLAAASMHIHRANKQSVMA